MRPLFDLTQIDFDQPLYTIDDIRAVNPQRHEMEQLSAIVHVDTASHVIVGYKALATDEFWCRGHMPGHPLMPGVLQCEAAAQLASFYSRKFGLLGGDFIGFGGIDDVRFRTPVYPGSRLDIVACAARLKVGRLAEFEFQGFVRGVTAFSGKMTGVAIAAAKSA